MIPLSNTDKIKGGIMAGLLIVLLVVGVMLLFRRTEKEGYVDKTSLRFVNTTVVDATGQLKNLPDSDIRDGFYITKRDSNGNIIEKAQLPYGYYKITDEHMAKIPNGYEVAKQGTDPDVDYMMNIVPRANSTRSYNAASEMAKGKDIPANGEIPEGYYNKGGGKMALLPPNTKPNIKSLLILGTSQSPVLKKTYNEGYVTEYQYYTTKYNMGRKYTMVNGVNKIDDEPTPEGTHVGDPPVQINDITIEYIGKTVIDTNGTIRIAGENEQPPEGSEKYIYPKRDMVFPLPEEVYYSPPIASEPVWTPNTIQFLPYGKTPTTVVNSGSFSYGYIDNPNLISPDGTFKYSQDYREISNNYDVSFHESAEELAKQQTGPFGSSFGSVTVLDKDGNLVSLPRTGIQGDVTYYTPGSYTFGAGSYVPKYEDSVYLSRTSHMPTMADYKSIFKKTGFCEADKASPDEIEAKCNALDRDVCASTSCCVLLGGAKCVSGNSNGPTVKAHYSDYLLRNKDSYMHLGKCYGNCT